MQHAGDGGPGSFAQMDQYHFFHIVVGVVVVVAVVVVVFMVILVLTLTGAPMLIIHIGGVRCISRYYLELPTLMHQVYAYGRGHHNQQCVDYDPALPSRGGRDKASAVSPRRQHWSVLLLRRRRPHLPLRV